MATVRLTDARIRALKPLHTTRDIRDSDLKGFGIRIMPSGRRRFFIHTQCDGRRIWKIIGGPEEMSLQEARDAARSALAAIRTGKPAVTLPGETLFEVVAEDMFRRYSRHWKPSTCKINGYYLRNQILPWFGDMQIADITGKDVQDWHASLSATPVAADRSAPVLSVIMAQAEIHGYRPENSNPCTGIRRYRRAGRERLLSAAELLRLGGVLTRHEKACPLPAAIISLLLLTGCRSSEIRTLQWRDYRDGHLHLRDSKTGPRTVWLSSPAREVLTGLPRTSRWMFPSRRIDGPVSKPVVQQFWQRLRAEAGLDDVRLHDARHTYASIAIMAGETVPVVGRLLGHNNAATTLKYTHLAETVMRGAADAMGGVLAGAGS